MAGIRHFWKVWLRPNRLSTAKEGSLLAEVVTGRSMWRNEDIARRIKENGSEFKYETILALINEHDRIARELLAEGHRVTTGLCSAAPSVTGVWDNWADTYDPARHRITVRLSPSHELRDGLASVGISMLGSKPPAAHIARVTDIFTGLSDRTATAGEYLRIEGRNIRVDGTAEVGAGVFFIAADGTAYPAARLVMNKPATLIIRLPDDLGAGEYTLRIATFFTDGSRTLAGIREIDSSFTITVNP